MRQSKFVKVITLSFFIFLVTGFVAYRSGILSDFTKEDISAKRDPGFQNDSPPVKPTIMPSSKSMQLPPDLMKNPAKQNQNANANQSNESSRRDSARRMEIMLSSKSGDIIRFDETDTSKKKPRVIMGSSKSKAVFEPKTETTKEKK